MQKKDAREASGIRSAQVLTLLYREKAFSICHAEGIEEQNKKFVRNDIGIILKVYASIYGSEPIIAEESMHRHH
ncbi:hypothetical protein [Sphingobium phenoxybenzoativorans]|uniref:hypothetical protein n=1 Tax=Sphingobium phenoxybenzoativorans TaxID=1592790 RepID=UPI000873473F|nr:hypothetical protein [Sphingobium phenoxybenzoativorans]